MNVTACKNAMDQITEGKEVKVTAKDYLFLMSYIERHRGDMEMAIQKLGSTVIILKIKGEDEKAKTDFTYTMFVNGVWWVCE